MEVIAKLLFVFGAVPTIVAIAMLVVLAPKPRRLEEHLQGLARYLMFGGAAFGSVHVIKGWAPPVAIALFMLGIGLGMVLFARQNHLLALAAEQIDDGAESGV